ncbi:MAG: long-chain fatty acid--CoA ligase [Candidatus Aminicenantes bacterium]|nr:MAG: long-chain fatty acid--CoA ligase [Candidatus Aminicenantes bacterium]
MVETINQLLLNTIKSFPKDDLMLHKKEGQYVPISTEEFANKVRNLSLGLKDLGIEAGDKLIILSETRSEWVMMDFANLCLGGITVPIYTTLVPEQIKYIIDNSDAKVVVCSNQELWQKVEAVKSELTKVVHYISFEPDAAEGVLTLTEVLEKGDKIAQENPDLFEKMALASKPDDTVSIIYTSGTTGPPKGVMLTHSNFISNVKAVANILEISDKDTMLSFLPLSHVFERMATFTYLYIGASIGYAESMETVPQNWLEIRPTVMTAPPRLFEKLYAKVLESALSSSPLKRKIFFWAIKVGKKYGENKLTKQPISRWLQFKKNLAHKLVFSKIIEKTGGRFRFFISGSAPLSKDIAEFFHAIGLLVLEGYGLTETSPAITVNTFENLKFGAVGKPIPEVEVRIAEDGEILTRGPHIMKGYYKMERETAEVMEGGWFHTGDIGYLDEEGFLVITDRKKDIIVTSGGKNVAPQPIENLLKMNPYISNVMVIGDKKKFISALVVPEFEKLEEYAKSSGITYENPSDLTKKEEILNFMLAEVDRSSSSLASFERIKKIALLDREFEIEEGEMTPTLKVKRNIVEEKYKDLIESFYKEQGRNFP